MNNREVGASYEERALAFLKEKGFLLLEKNYRTREGEIDLIGTHENCLVFVEVKYRKNDAKGMPEEAVGITKQQKICSVADYYRMCHQREGSRQIRFDVIAICGEQIRWYQNAFPYQVKGNRRRF